MTEENKWNEENEALKKEHQHAKRMLVRGAIILVVGSFVSLGSYQLVKRNGRDTSAMIATQCVGLIGTLAVGGGARTVIVGVKEKTKVKEKINRNKNRIIDSDDNE